jgi:hypothetical protein
VAGSAYLSAYSKLQDDLFSKFNRILDSVMRGSSGISAVVKASVSAPATAAKLAKTSGEVSLCVAAAFSSLTHSSS